jgi:hypothetical protein
MNKLDDSGNLLGLFSHLCYSVYCKKDRAEKKEYTQIVDRVVLGEHYMIIFVYIDTPERCARIMLPEIGRGEHM